MASMFAFGKRKIDRADLLWLAYLVFFIIQPVARRSIPYWIECLGVIAFFLALYFKYLRSNSATERLVICLGMTVLGAVSTPFNGGGIAFLIYSSALLPYALSGTPWVLAITSVNVLIIAAEGAYLHFGIFEAFLNIFFAVLVSSTNMIFAQKERSDSRLRMQQEEIEALAAVAERERIARDLHDVLGHTLSLIVLKGELAGRLLDRELASAREDVSSNIARARGELGELERSARSALVEVREAIGGYRARGLTAEIENARIALSAAGVDLLVQGEVQPAGLSAGEETVLALALREAVTNIVRHAHATECRLLLVLQDGHHRLSIQDNGQHPAEREGNGLRGMRERVEAVGGQLSLNRDAGTHLLIELPLRLGTTSDGLAQVSCATR